MDDLPNIVDGGDTGGGAPAAPAAPASPASPAAAPTEVKFPENWKLGLPKEFQDEPSLKNVLDVPTLAKNYINAQKMIGADKISIPSKHATDDDWKAVFQKLGNPAELKDYELSAPKDAPFDADALTKFKEIAHANGVLPKQANKILEWYGKNIQEQMTSVSDRTKAEHEKEWGGLRETWGEAFDNKILAAKTAIKEFADPDVVEFLRTSNLGTNPKLAKFFSKIGETMLEDKLKGKVQREEGGRDILDPKAAKEKANQIMADKSHPYNIKGHPNHKAAVDEVQELFKMRFGTGPAKQ